MANKPTPTQINDLRKAIESGLTEDYPMGLELSEQLIIVEQRLRTILEFSDLAKPPLKEDLITRI